MTKERLDQLLVRRGFLESRNQAYAAIVTGEVKVNGAKCVKPAQPVDESATIDYEPASAGYVSRGGIKLAQALDQFQIDVTGLTVLDAGSSTGGFTDCLLRRGAAKVIAVDVGYGQLAWKLRSDARVEVLERVNLRFLELAQISEPAKVATLDLSFISLTLVVPAVVRCLTEDGSIVALVKPQFEVGKGKVGRTGVVTDPRLHSEVLTRLARHFVESGLTVNDMHYSPLLGAKGNIEYWLYLSKKPLVGYPFQGRENPVAETVAAAHAALGRTDRP